MAQTHFLTASFIVVVFLAVADDSDTNKPVTINVLSYNVQSFGGFLQRVAGGYTGEDDDNRIKTVPDTAAKLAPDLICFQEAFSGKFNKIVDEWMTTTAYRYKSGPIIGSKWRGQFLNSGVILLSKTEFTREQSQVFESACGLDRLAAKGFLYVETTIDNRLVGIVATHLQADDRCCAWLEKNVADAAQDVRKQQLIQIEKFLADNVKNGSPRPDVILLVGDLNIDSWDANDQCPKFDQLKDKDIEGAVGAQQPIFGEARPTLEVDEAQPTMTVDEAGESQPTMAVDEAQPTMTVGDAQPTTTTTNEKVPKASYDANTNSYCQMMGGSGTYHLDYVLALNGGMASDVKVVNKVVQVRDDKGNDLSDHHAVLGSVTIPDSADNAAGMANEL
jgi:endonuclease/exonuclease/phosphatase family metal-dependent hydrolase